MGKIVFDDGYDIFSVNLDGTHLTRLTDHPEHDANPQCSPDGKKIAFNSSRDRTGGFSWGVYVMNADGTNPILLTGPQDAGGPAWSPDGTKIAYSEGGNIGDIFIIDADGSNAVLLTQKSAGSFDIAPTWSPDGKKIAFASYYLGPDSMGVAVIDRDGTNWTRLGGYSITNSIWREQGFSGPAWSPDGEKIAYVFDYDIWVMNADGTNPINITNAADMFERAPAWFPDSSQIMFERDGQIIVMNRDGTSLRTLFAGNNPSWWPLSDLTAIEQVTWGIMKRHYGQR